MIGREQEIRFHRRYYCFAINRWRDEDENGEKLLKSIAISIRRGQLMREWSRCDEQDQWLSKKHISSRATNTVKKVEVFTADTLFYWFLERVTIPFDFHEVEYNWCEQSPLSIESIDVIRIRGPLIFCSRIVPFFHDVPYRLCRTYIHGFYARSFKRWLRSTVALSDMRTLVREGREMEYRLFRRIRSHWRLEIKIKTILL